MGWLETFQEWVGGLFENAAPILQVLLVDGILGGVIAVIGFLPLVMVMYFGAIQEELIRCGKKSWVQLLTLSIMMLPASMMSVTSSGDINVYLTVLGFISLCYCSWIYSKTRSTIILIVLYFVSNLVPFQFESKVLGILLLIAGTALTIGGFAALSRKLPEMLVKDED